MNGLLFLLCCVEILGALLCGVKCNPEITSGEMDDAEDAGDDDETLSTKQHSGSVPPSHPASTVLSETSSLMNAEIFTTVSLFSNPGTSSGPQHPKTTATTTTTTTATTTATSTATTTATTTTSTPLGLFFRQECLTVYIVSGGLIIACSILLVSTMLLAWKVCQLSRHLKMLSSEGDLVSTSEYWMGTAKKNKSKSETQTKETTILMADLSQTQEDTADDTTKEEGGKVNEDGQMGEENKTEVGDTEEAPTDENEKETPAAVAENPSSSKAQEDTSDSKSTKAVAASSSEGTEEPEPVA